MILGLGTDIIEVGRVEEKLVRTAGLKAKLFTPGEIAYCEAKHRPALHFAARFAAKEAFLKALGMGVFGGVALREIEVVREPGGAPLLRLGPTAAAALRQAGGDHPLLSLSHEREMALAFVVVP